jgi:hypothetical protein
VLAFPALGHAAFPVTDKRKFDNPRGGHFTAHIHLTPNTNFTPAGSRANAMDAPSVGE